MSLTCGRSVNSEKVRLKGLATRPSTVMRQVASTNGGPSLTELMRKLEVPPAGGPPPAVTRGNMSLPTNSATIPASMRPMKVRRPMFFSSLLMPSIIAACGQNDRGGRR